MDFLQKNVSSYGSYYVICMYECDSSTNDQELGYTQVDKKLSGQKRSKTYIFI